jgi:hypothetical protein
LLRKMAKQQKVNKTGKGRVQQIRKMAKQVNQTGKGQVRQQVQQIKWTQVLEFAVIGIVIILGILIIVFKDDITEWFQSPSPPNDDNSPSHSPTIPPTIPPQNEAPPPPPPPPPPPKKGFLEAPLAIHIIGAVVGSFVLVFQFANTRALYFYTAIILSLGASFVLALLSAIVFNDAFEFLIFAVLLALVVVPLTPAGKKMRQVRDILQVTDRGEAPDILVDRQDKPVTSEDYEEAIKRMKMKDYEEAIGRMALAAQEDYEIKANKLAKAEGKIATEKVIKEINNASAKFHRTLDEAERRAMAEHNLDISDIVNERRGYIPKPTQ